MDAIKIRKVKFTDAKYFVKLSEEIGYPSSIADLKKRLKEVLKQKGDILLVAVAEDGGVVGFIQGISRIEILTPKTIILGGIVVDPSCQKKGIGRKLMAALEKYAKTKKYKTILVPTNIKRKAIHPFYEKLGYQKQKIQIIYCKEY